MGIKLESKGNFKKTIRFLDNIIEMDPFIERTLRKYGAMGVKRLKEYTPRDSGKTAESWTYQVSVTDRASTVSWWNENVNNGVPIALVIEYGHITGWGGYVPPHPYISEALLPVILELQDKIWEGVTNG